MNPKIINVKDSGRVCYETQKGPSHYVTVECAISQKAYRFKDPLDPCLQVGDWVSLSGAAKVNRIHRGSQPEMLERITYCHQPYDGSNREEWEYLELEEAGAQITRIPPLDVKISITDSLRHLNRHLTDWDSHYEAEQLILSINALENTVELLRFWLKRKLEEEDSKNSLKLF